jgi:hypothetical protein
VDGEGGEESVGEFVLSMVMVMVTVMEGILVRSLALVLMCYASRSCPGQRE